VWPELAPECILLLAMRFKKQTPLLAALCEYAVLRLLCSS
jgi:hypothetical protein